jgi:hypothetical protein
VLQWLFLLRQLNSKNAGPFKGVLIRRFLPIGGRP